MKNKDVLIKKERKIKNIGKKWENKTNIKCK